jgi:coproporphyrinogen III oxidase-like Fe-S oxidoreductase
LREGVSLSAFAARYAMDLLETLGDTGEALLRAGVLELEGERLRIGADHQLITNEILVRLEAPLEHYVRRETSASQIAAR